MKGFDVICINSDFTTEQLEIWSKFGVVYPLKDKLYTIRDIIVHSGGEGTGVLLEEIVNPPVPVNNGIIEIMRETTFRINRFRDLQGLPLKKEEIEVKETNYTEI
jgi:hypothetical protein